MTKYEALLVAPDGDFMPDFGEDTIEKVQNDLANMGSKWIFYPYVFIIRTSKTYKPSDLTSYNIENNLKKKKIVDAPEPLEFMKGWTVGRAIKKIVTENSKLKEGDYLLGPW